MDYYCEKLGITFKGIDPKIYITPYQIERELLRLKNALGKAREKLNQRAEDYLNATREYKKEFAKTFVAAKIQGNKTVKECEMLAQQATAGLEAMYKATEQLVLNERKAVDTVQITLDNVMYNRR